MRLVLIILLMTLSPFVSSKEDSEVLFDRLQVLESQVNCNKQYQNDEFKIENDTTLNAKKIAALKLDILKKYVECVDFLVQRQSESESLYKYTVQLFVTPNEGKARDLVSDYNKIKNNHKAISGFQATYIPYNIAYPGSYKLNDGKYYKIIVGAFDVDTDASSLLKDIKDVFKHNYKDAFITKVPQ